MGMTSEKRGTTERHLVDRYCRASLAMTVRWLISAQFIVHGNRCHAIENDNVRWNNEGNNGRRLNWMGDFFANHRSAGRKLVLR